MKLSNVVRIPSRVYEIVTDVSDKEAKYETALMLSAVSVIVLSLADLMLIQNRSFTLFVETFDLIVCGAFAIDLYRKYKRVDKKKGFFWSHIVEIVSIVPFDFVFRAFRLVRLLRYFKLGRLSKLGRLGNLLNKIITKFATPSVLRYKRYKNIIFARGLEEDDSTGE